MIREKTALEYAKELKEIKKGIINIQKYCLKTNTKCLCKYGKICNDIVFDNSILALTAIIQDLEGEK